MPGAFRSFEVGPVWLQKRRRLTTQKYLEIKTDAEAQFIVGLFHSTGLGGVEEDQGKVSLPVYFTATDTHHRHCCITLLPLCKATDPRRWRWDTVIGQV